MKLNSSIIAGYILGTVLVIATVLLSLSLYEDNTYLLLGGLVLLQGLFGIWALIGNKKCPTKDDEIYQVWKDQLPNDEMKKKRSSRALLYLFITAVLTNGSGYLLYNDLFLSSSGDWKYVLLIIGLIWMIIAKKEFAKGPTIRAAKEIYKEIEEVLHSNGFPFNRYKTSHPEFTPDSLMLGELCSVDLDFYTMTWLYQEMLRKHTIALVSGSAHDDKLSSAWKTILSSMRVADNASTEEEKNAALNSSTELMIQFGKLLCESFQRLGDYAVWVQEGIDRHATNELQNSI